MSFVKFTDLLDTSIGPKSIIIGNGFGISYDNATGENNFNWNTLLDLCDIKAGSEIYQLLNECNFDFELTHQKISNALDVIKTYSPSSDLIEILASQIQYLRDQLIIAVSRSHPSAFTRGCSNFAEEIERDNRINACRTFLSKFDYIFSLNYDLLLYWIRCYKNKYLGCDSFERVDDELTFAPKDEANFLFPHGALFIYRDGISATKSSSSKSNPILARVETNIDKGIFPMCVSEGTGAQKLESIKRNYYLSYSYNKIKDSSGTIFTFGCSFLDSKDDHIIEAIIKSNAEKIVIGEFNPTIESKLRLLHAFEKSNSGLKNPKDITIADTNGSNIWGAP